jgi:cell division protein ZipA
MALTDGDEAHDREADGAMHAHVEAHAPGPLDELPTLIIPDEDKRSALKAAWDEPLPPEPRLIDPAVSNTIETVASVELAKAQPPAPPEPAPSAAPPPAAAPAPAAVSAEPEIAGAEGVGTVRIVEPAPAADAAAPPEPIVDWPPEETRRILALRLVAPQAERFSGRALRLALAAEGFLLGRFAIFHKPDESNRAVLSAAALTRPGAFDLETMDSQRYAGLSLFAVLPGPKTPQQAFEELLATARNLNERLEGALQDERGGPLTPLRVASIRDNLRAEAATLKTAAAQ